MSYDRQAGAAAPGAEPGPPANAAVEGEQVPSALRVQILSTEHYSLLSSRQLAWNEAFNRASMFLSTVAGSIVALALVAQASDFGEGFRLFGLVILPVVLYIGIGTVLRIGESNYHDAVCVTGMNRIRAAYLDLAPDLAPVFVMGTTADEAGVAKTMALSNRQLLVHMLAATPMMIATLKSVLFAAIVALFAIEVGAPSFPALGVGAVAFVLLLAAHAVYGRREIHRGRIQLASL